MCDPQKRTILAFHTNTSPVLFVSLRQQWQNMCVGSICSWAVLFPTLYQPASCWWTFKMLPVFFYNKRSWVNIILRISWHICVCIYYELSGSELSSPKGKHIKKKTCDTFSSLTSERITSIYMSTHRRKPPASYSCQTNFDYCCFSELGVSFVASSLLAFYHTLGLQPCSF